MRLFAGNRRGYVRTYVNERTKKYTLYIMYVVHGTKMAESLAAAPILGFSLHNNYYVE